MELMFNNSMLFNGDILKWNVFSVVDMNSMFFSVINFNSNISGWNIIRVENILYIFYDVRSFNKNLSNWDISRVIVYNDWCNGLLFYNNKYYYFNFLVIEKLIRGLFW